MKQFKLYFIALVALFCTVSFSVNAVINVGDTITMDGVIFKVPAGATNLIANPSFQDSLNFWTSGLGAPILAANFTVKDSGGVSNSKYLVGTANLGSNTVGALRTLWPLQLGKGYLLSYYCKYQDTSKVTATEQYLKVSQTNAAGTESLIHVANSTVGGKNVWAMNQTAFTGKYNSLQVHFRWLNGTYGFDEFALIKLDSIGLDLAAINAAIANAQTYIASNYPGVGALNAAITAAEAAKATITGPASITTIVNNLATAVRSYRLTQTVAPGDSLNFTFAITNPGMDGASNSALPNGWNITYTNGNGYTGTGQHYSGVTSNRYMDSWNGTVGALIYVAQQKVVGLPKGTYRVAAAARASGNGAYVTGNDRQSPVPVNNDAAGTLGPTLKGWNLVKVDTIINVSDAVTIGAKTTVGWTGTWFSADDFTLTYFGEKVADYQKYMSTVATSVRNIDLATVPNGVDALITATLAKSDTASTVASVLAVTNQLVAARDSATFSVAPYASLKALIVTAGALDSTYTGLATFRTAIAAANTLVGSATAMRPEILAGIKTLNNAMMAYQYTKPASATSPADFTFAIANASFEQGNTTGWMTSANASDVGAKLNSNATYTMAGTDGSYLFNIWGGTTLPFFVKQDIMGLPKGTYKLIATVATDSLNTIKLFANGMSKDLLPNNKGLGKTDTLDVVTVADGKLTIGAQSQTWFKADNFRLLFYPAVDYTSSIVNPGVDASGSNVQPNGWLVVKGVGNNMTGTGQHYSKVTTNRYFDSWNGTTGAMIYTATQVVKNLPNGIYSVSAAARTSGLKSYIFGNDSQAEIINNGGAGGTLGNGFNTITVDKVVVMDSTVTLGVKTVPGWTGQWFSADDFTMSFVGPGDFASYKSVLDSLVAKAKRFDLNTSPNGLDAALSANISTAEAATDVATVMSSYKDLKIAYDINVASVPTYTKLTSLIASSTTLSNTTNYNGLAALKTAITAAETVANGATTMPVNVDTAIVNLNKALYNYKVTQPAPADFTFIMANPGFEDGTFAGIDPSSVKKNGSFNTPIGWNNVAIIDTLAPGANFVGISGTSMAEGTKGYETWVQGGFSKSITLSQKVVAPGTGYYILTANARCDGSSPSLTDPKLYDAHLFTKIGENPESTSKKLADIAGLITGSGWNAKTAWRTLSLAFTANAGDTIKLGIASTSFMQLDNFTLAYKGKNNPATLDVAYITKVKPMDAGADSVMNDPVYRMLSADTLLKVTLIPLTNVSATATIDQSAYDAMVIQESLGGGDAILFPANALGLPKLSIPTLYNKTYAFKAGRAFASGAAGTGAEALHNVMSIKADTISQKHPIFKGLTFVADTLQLFTALAQDNGAAPVADITKNKALNVANAVVGAEGTLLAAPTGMTPVICVNDILAGDTIGGQILKSRLITFGMNFGTMCRNFGQNMTNANYTMWRNAVYTLVGLPVPSTPLNIITAIAKPANANGTNVVVYPNPTADIINISNLNMNSIVKIYTLTGQQVFDGKANSDVMTVDMSKYNSGIYMLQVVSNGKSMKSKIIKK